MSHFNDIMAIRAAVLTVTTDCQLRCSYCFEENKAKNYMSVEDARSIAKTLCDNFRDKVFSGDNTAKLSISFFGGEPTLNFDAIKAVVEYCNEQEFIVQYGITTNCVHITDDMIEYFYDNNFGILVSIDGTRELHNRNRSNSYDTVVANIQHMMEEGLKLNMEARITVPPADIDKLYDSMVAMYDVGFDQIAPCVVYDQEWTEEQHVEYENQIRKIYEFAFDKYNSESHRNLQIKNIEDYIYACYDQPTNDISPCGFGTPSWVAIGYDGEVTPCHQVHTNFRSNEALHMGNILTDEIDESVLLRIRSEFDRSECGNCDYFHVCRGGCPAESFGVDYDFNALNPAVCRHMEIMYTIAKEYQEKILSSSNLRSRRLNVLKRNLEFKDTVVKAMDEFPTNDMDSNLLNLSKIQEHIFGGEKILLPAYIKLAERAIDLITNQLLLELSDTLEEYQREIEGGE